MPCRLSTWSISASRLPSGSRFSTSRSRRCGGLGLRDGLKAALKADALSLLAFEVGLFGWMALMQLVFFPEHIKPDQAAYWGLMQLGMALGFLTAFPVNVWLIRRGIKEAM